MPISVPLIFKSNKETNKYKLNHTEEFRTNNKFQTIKAYWKFSIVLSCDKQFKQTKLFTYVHWNEYSYKNWYANEYETCYSIIWSQFFFFSNLLLDLFWWALLEIWQISYKHQNQRLSLWNLLTWEAIDSFNLTDQFSHYIYFTDYLNKDKKKKKIHYIYT